jgi:hypothetical protein
MRSFHELISECPRTPTATSSNRTLAAVLQRRKKLRTHCAPVRPDIRLSLGADRRSQGDGIEHPAQGPAGGAPKRVHGAPGGRHCLPARLQDGAGRDRLERLEARYRSGRPDWRKFKNLEATSVSEGRKRSVTPVSV